jgi:predicted ABC-type sugar transport system permease subunit
MARAPEKFVCIGSGYVNKSYKKYFLIAIAVRFIILMHFVLELTIAHVLRFLKPGSGQ